VNFAITIDYYWTFVQVEVVFTGPNPILLGQYF